MTACACEKMHPQVGLRLDSLPRMFKLLGDLNDSLYKCALGSRSAASRAQRLSLFVLRPSRRSIVLQKLQEEAPGLLTLVVCSLTESLQEEIIQIRSNISSSGVQPDAAFSLVHATIQQWATMLNSSFLPSTGTGCSLDPAPFTEEHITHIVNVSAATSQLHEELAQLHEMAVTCVSAPIADKLGLLTKIESACIRCQQRLGDLVALLQTMEETGCDDGVPPTRRDDPSDGH